VFAAWVIFPLALTFLCLGLGLLAEAASGRRVPGALLPSLGLATLTVLGLATTASASTADWTTPVAVVLALLGFVVTDRRVRDFRPERGAVLVALGIFLIFGAPVILSGDPTFAGYIKLDDTATWFALTDRLMEHGRSLDGLPPSSYEATLALNLAGWYPIGAFIPLGTSGKLVDQELAWIFQPYLALLASFSALALWQLAARFQARAFAVFIAAQAALLFAYAMWGGIKELVTVALLGLAAGLVPSVLEDERPSLRSLLPLALASAALVGALSFGAGPWLLGLLGAAGLMLLSRAGFRSLLRTGGLFVVWAVPLIVIGLVGHSLFPESNALVSSGNDLGNLTGPINPFHAVGIWPAADFRIYPKSGLITFLLISVAVVAALFGAWLALRDRDAGLLTALGGAAFGGLVIAVVGSAWVGAKAYAVVSPFALLFAFAGISGAARSGHRTMAAVAAVLIALGVIWSNILGYGGVSLAPREQLGELEQIGNEFAGVEPTLMTEYQPYGVRHFLRDMAPEGASELRRRTVALTDGASLEKGETADTDRFALSELLTYKALVLRRSPAHSRPPSPYTLAWKGEEYEVWVRQEDVPVPTQHLGLGNEVEPAAVPTCADVRRLADEAGPNGSLIAAGVTSQPIALELGSAELSGGLVRSAAGSTYVEPIGSGDARLTTEVPTTGTYEFWLGGSLRSSAKLDIDGEEVGEARHHLNTVGNYIPLGSTDLAAGSHNLMLSFGSADLHPGSAGIDGPLGPLIIAERIVPPPLTTVSPSEAAALCGQAWDWIEVVPG
jgi:hypothetical protein